MKTGKSILLAFLLNLCFSIFELIGGLFTGSVAIASDALHDMGDAVSIGISYALERKSHRPADTRYTYGYGRYSVIGGAITTLILLAGSIMIIGQSIQRIVDPSAIHYDGMLFMAVIGAAVNFIAAWFTRDGDSINQKAVNLHMLEDVLGWIVVLVGAVVMRCTGWVILDPIMSMGVAVFILFHAIRNLSEILSVISEKIPDQVDPEQLTNALTKLPGILDIHHLHIWSLDGHQHCATVHIVSDDDPHQIKDAVRDIFEKHHINHVTIESETPQEHCHHSHCHISAHAHAHHHHHHH